MAGETIEDEMEAEASEGSDDGSSADGTLYIMRERDYRTAEVLDYFKIGIVRGEKDVKDRERNHRTGNPRSIETIFEIRSPMVQKLETLLHNRYATKRVSSGEWFCFQETELEDLYQTARTFSKEIENYADLLRSSSEWLTFTPDVTIPATESQTQAALEYLRTQETLGLVGETKKEIAAKLRQLAEDNPSLVYLFKASTTAETNKFTATKLQKLFPQFYKEYKTKISVSTKFDFYFEPDQHLESNLFKLMDIDAGQEPRDLHQHYLKLWGLEFELKWQLEVTKTRLLVQGQGAQEVVGIYRWDEKPITSFDSAKFKIDHPEEYELARELKPAKTTTAIAEWASYLY